jgi:head-tail adaptor
MRDVALARSEEKMVELLKEVDRVDGLVEEIEEEARINGHNEEVEEGTRIWSAYEARGITPYTRR